MKWIELKLYLSNCITHTQLGFLHKQSDTGEKNKTIKNKTNKRKWKGKEKRPNKMGTPVKKQKELEQYEDKISNQH